jgi:probable rRNA maturation factor
VSLTIEVVTEAPAWEGLPAAEALARRAAEAALASERVREGELAILLADDARMRALNREHRGIDKATNVLSFPAAKVADDARALGDLVLAYETLTQEAAAEGKPLSDHLMHLVVHGTLHLLGFDHMREADADIMEARERQILAALGVPDPYAERERAGATA